MCGIIFVYTLILKTTRRQKMKGLIVAVIVLVISFGWAIGCTLNLKGLNATDGDKTLNVESLETKTE